MSQKEIPKEIVKAVDSLINELDRLARDPLTNSQEFFGQVGETIETVLAPNQQGIFFRAADNHFLNCDESGASLEQMIPAWKLAIEQLEGSKADHLTDKQGSETRILFGIFDQQKAPADRSNTNFDGVIVVQIDSNLASQSTISILRAVAKLSGLFLSKRVEAGNHQDLMRRYADFSMGCLSSTQTKRLAHIICNDARLLFECERLQIFEKTGSGLVLRAVSSVAIFEKRSALLRSATKIANSAFKLRRPVISSQDTQDQRLQADIEDYESKSQLPFFICFPLQLTTQQGKTTHRVGVLLAEFTQAPRLLEFSRTANVVVPQATLALSNARKISSIPFQSLFFWLCTNFKLQNVARIAMFALVPLALVLATLIIQIDFKVRISGKLQAVNERQVFAPRDAFISEVLVDQGQEVAKGDLLVLLRSPELELQVEEAAGEIKKLEKYQLAKEITLNQASSGNSADAATMAQLASEIADLEYQIQAKKEEHEFSLRRIKELEVLAPIDGKVVTWQAKRKLIGKPIRWGDSLMKLADENSDWELRFNADEKKVGYILDAIRNHERPEDVSVSYFLHSDPKQKYSTRIRQIGNSTEMKSDVGHAVSIDATVSDEQLIRRHGAQVSGDIDCGKRSIAYVWTYEVIDAIRRKFVW